MRGKVIILNGTSSAGKTKLGRTLERLLNRSSAGKYVFLETGDFVANSFEYFYKHHKNKFDVFWTNLIRIMFREVAMGATDSLVYKKHQDEVVRSLDAMSGGVHDTLHHTLNCEIYKKVKELSDAGTHVILEVILAYPEMLDCLRKELAGYPVSLIKVFCPLDELKRRERVRGNRPVGFTEQMFHAVHQYRGEPIEYDFEVNTCSLRLDEYAQAIQGFIRSPQSPRHQPPD